MARTSTPLSCLTLFCFYLAAAAADQQECSDSAAAASWAAAEEEQGQGLELLQRKSMKLNASKAHKDAWQCHKYGPGEDDDWCASAGVQGGYEYLFNEGEESECGDCWCCKRSVKAEIADEDDGPDWQCHDYEDGEDNDWCIEQSSDKSGEFEFSWTGGKVELQGCGDCWCCKRNAQWRWESKEKDSKDWTCHKYKNGQNDDWCASAGVHQGFEYAFNGGDSSPCGDCWCCKREVDNNQPLRISHELQEKKAPKEIVPASTSLAEPPWECFYYNEEQDNDWCIDMTNKDMREFEFAYTGGKVDLCGDCWCCRRSKTQSMGLAQISSGHISTQGKGLHHALTSKSHGQAHHAHTAESHGRVHHAQTAESHGRVHHAQTAESHGRAHQAHSVNTHKGATHHATKAVAHGAAHHVSRSTSYVGASHSMLVMKKRKQDEWQCHQYEDGEDDDWCASAGVQEGFEYAFNGGEFEQCGDCWCCKRSVGDSQPIKHSQMQQTESSWQCHTYDKEEMENDEWCIGMANSDEESGYEFAYTGGQVDLCGDCWCCKRETGVKAAPEEHKKPKEHKSHALLKESSWACHDYTDDQNDDWCESAGIQGGFEYKFTAGESDECGDCWCCKRQAKEEEDEKEVKEEGGPWECLKYDEEENQDNDWCASTKYFGGYELAYTGGETDLCGDCWCCKRSLW